MEILHQCVSKVTYTHNDNAVLIIYTQNAADFCAQLADIVAVALLAEFAKAAEILTDLGSGNAHSTAERVGGDANDTLVVKIIKVAVISG